MKHRVVLLTGLLLLASLLFVPAADAQWRWFGPKAADKTPAKAPLVDPRRAMEVNVEIAWLADPVTFPYYLEAHADSGQFEVRGYVPNKGVREHALRIAQVYSSVPVTDAMKEHPSLLVKPSQMSPQQLQNSAQSSLRAALPKQYQQLKIDCGADGKVVVAGSVSTLEEKIAVSHALRRLHGCTSVQNLTSMPIEIVQSSPPAGREKLPIVKTSNPSDAKAETKSKSWFSWPFGKGSTTTDEPPLLEVRKPDPKAPVLADVKNAPNQKPDGPILIQNVTDPKKPTDSKGTPGEVTVEQPVEPAKTPMPVLTVAELQKTIQTACPKVLSVEVEFTSAKELRVTMEIRTDAELSPTAEKVFAMPELQNYRLDLQFKISAP
jgi:hypothetical protein